MLANVHSFVLTGVDASPCEIEVDLVESGLPREQIVGLPDATVRESLERVRSALHNGGYAFPTGRLLINLAPAHVRKAGSAYELPIAVGVLMASGAVRPPSAPSAPCAPSAASVAWDDTTVPEYLDPRQALFAGEVALDGSVRPVRGVVAMALLAKQLGRRWVVVPSQNAEEASVVDGVEALGVRSVAEVVGLLQGELSVCPHPPVRVAERLVAAQAEVDFSHVRGQEGVKRALTVAAAGGHNALMLGPPGTGKTMMAKALPGILPPLTPSEALEVTRIYSAAGRLGRESSSGSLVTSRPVRAPHHSASSAALVGGGTSPKPGEVTLAHHGVLFLDELPEFSRAVLETLRQPLEDGEITVARAAATARFPASCMLIAAMNPSPRGTVDGSVAGARAASRYLGRVSGPLIDRIDIHVEAPAVPWEELSSRRPEGAETSGSIRDRVLCARKTQSARQGSVVNARLRGDALDAAAVMDSATRDFLGQAVRELGLSARAYDKVRRVARTIADLDGDGSLGVGHVAEAVQYRLLDRLQPA